MDTRKEIEQLVSLERDGAKIVVSLKVKRAEMGFKSSIRVTSGLYNGRLIRADEVLRIVSMEEIENQAYGEF